MLKTHRFQKSEWRISTALLLGALTLSGCGVSVTDSETGEVEKVERIKAVDGVKLISADIRRGDDPRTFQQLSYILSSRSRLLLRSEDFAESADLVSRDRQSVVVRVILTQPDLRDQAGSELVVCPLQVNWMMAATWYHAHPYLRGRWQSPGGDIHWGGCVSPMNLTDATTSDPNLRTSERAGLSQLFGACREQPGALCFDVTAWFRTNLVEARRNYGLAIVVRGSGSYQVQGDAGTEGPRLHWIRDIPRTVTTITYWPIITVTPLPPQSSPAAP